MVYVPGHTISCKPSEVSDQCVSAQSNQSLQGTMLIVKEQEHIEKDSEDRSDGT